MVGQPQPIHTPPQTGLASEVQSIALGRYVLEERLGHGGAATVFRARDRASGKAVAIKRLAAEANQRLATLFELEYHTLASIRHPNIVEAYDFGRDQTGPYYVMELLEGEDLSVRGRLPWREAALCASEVAGALAALHARRFVHRDVSARNVWRTPSGRMKLIDFGALSPFGAARDLVGTPPHVAPEALDARALDQRTDLYALGALMYWLLTGAHAYPARSLRDLPALWREPVSTVTERMRRLELSEGEAIPAELDALVMSLLSQNPMARPSTTGEVVDRLAALTGQTRAPQATHADSLLIQPSLVGRERERKHFARQLEQLGHGHGEAALIVGGRGYGRTRLLAELATDARLQSVQVIEVAARDCTGSHGVAERLLERILDTLPDATRELVQRHKATLAALSPRMRERLEVPRLSMANAPDGLRTSLHDALTELVTSVSARTPMVVFIDDFEHADESSMAWLTTLTERLFARRLLLVLAFDEGELANEALALRSLRQNGKRSALKALTIEETTQLVTSLFGEVPHVGRVAERLWRAASGVPARIVELTRHLVREGAIGNSEGTWVLPQELPQELLSVARGEQLKTSVARLSDDARALGVRLSVQEGLIPIALCRTLSQLPTTRMFTALEELVREGVLATSSSDYRFHDEALRLSLLHELSPHAMRAAHQAVGEYMLSQTPLSVPEELSALVHLMEGGDTTRAPVRLSAICRDLVNNVGDTDSATQSIAILERAYQLFRASGKREHELVPLLALLATNGYFSDRRLLLRYGSQAVTALQNTLGLTLAGKLRRWLGKKLGLIVGLVVGAVRFSLRKSPYLHTFPDMMTMLFHVWGCQSGVATICVDPEEVLRVCRSMEIMTALGPRHLATFIYQYNLALAVTVQERVSEAHQRWQEVIRRLEDQDDLKGLPEHARKRFLAGAVFCQGVIECWRDDPNALRIAERLEAFELKLYRTSADQIRATYYSNQGNQELYQHYRRRVEMHAIQRGSTWQVETWSPGATITVALRAHDAMALKESHEQLLRLKQHTPSMALLAERCRGAFLYARRRYEEALPVLEQCLQEKPLAVIGWARAHGVLAACLNALGQHARAKQVCVDALGRLAPNDSEFPAMNLVLSVELAQAEAGLGETARATEMLDGLIERHRVRQGALTMGALHEARARVALRSGDAAGAEQHSAEMQRYYFQTGLSSLIARCESFTRETRRALRRSSDNTNHDPALDLVTDLLQTGPTMLERALSQGDPSPGAKARRALSVLASDLGDTDGALFALQNDEAVMIASAGDRVLAPELSAWVSARLSQVRNDDVTETDFVDLTDTSDPDVFERGGARYRLFLLSTLENEANLCAGAAVLIEPPAGRRVVGASLLQAVAQWILRGTTNGPQSSSDARLS